MRITIGPLGVSTHPNPDHVGALVEVQKTMRADKVAYNRDAHYCRLLKDFLNAIGEYPATVHIEVRRG